MSALSPEDLACIDRVSLRVGRPRAGVTAGLRRSPRSGSSIEFADFRSYASGDDFRRVDWKAYARLERLVVRLYEGEEDTCVSVWVDTSASMAWGGGGKLRCAARLAGALAYIALGGYDRATVLGFADRVVARAPPVRGRSAAPRIWRVLEGLSGEGVTDWTGVSRSARGVPAGVAVIVSDFLTDTGPGAALAALRQTGHDVAMVQVLAPQELRPDLEGDLRLVDVETASAVDITANSAALGAYRDALTAHSDGLRVTAAAYGAPFVQLDSGRPVIDLVLGPLRQVGIVQ
jgi:uncharacterized protein (DUF58 family)